MKHYCDEVKELVCSYNKDLKQKIQNVEINNKKEVENVKKELAKKTNNDQISVSLDKIEYFKKKLDDMYISTNNNLDK